jgi:hypothetical protein
MILPASSAKTLRAPAARVPRLHSLEHRLEHARDANGQPIALRDELLFLLDDPPANTVDRWQAGADLCARHGIQTSRVAVWRYFRANILPWRRGQNPPPPAAAPDPREIEGLHARARLLLAQRLVDVLGDPGLSPGHLVALIQNDNVREKIELARARFQDRVAERQTRLNHEKMLKTYEEAGRRAVIPKELDEIYQIARRLDSIPPRSTS